MRKILLDTNVILDIALNRQPFFQEAEKVFLLLDSSQLIAYVSASTITDIYYITRKAKGHSLAINFLKDLLQFVEVAGVDHSIILSAITMQSPDFEDAVQMSAAAAIQVDFIITRNQPDFSASPIPVYSPADFLSFWNQKS
ncbi:MAG: PIN domain-containing protein [Bacteroidota bacterium]